MVEEIHLSLAWLSAVLGMSWLALSLEVHWRQVAKPHWSRSQAQVTGVRVAGILSLLTSLVLCLLADHPSMAILVWLMMLTSAALAVALALTWCAHRLRFLLWVAACRPPKNTAQGL